MTNSLHWLDWLVIAVLLGGSMAVGFYFTSRAGKNVKSYFLSGGSVSWWITGAAMVSATFAADTPLWVTSLIRTHGVFYVWQYWCQFIGYGLAIALFARLWRRMKVVTDAEFIELRYSGGCAKTLRFWEGSTKALLLCPLVIGWVTKAMETITREAMGVSPENRVWTTLIVLTFALAMCTFGGLWGVLYTGAIQLVVKFVGIVILAIMSVHYVGGLDVMVHKLSAGNTLNFMPSIGNGFGQMSFWNAIGYFGILWFYNALCPDYTAQRILACKDGRNSSFMILMYAVIAGGVIVWPWIITGLCSIIALPDLGAGVSNDSAFPRMIVTVLPIGLRGLLVAALLAAFTATITTLLNWGSSYLVNDVYRRFFVRNSSEHHYIYAARLATVFMGVIGALISFLAHDIQQLLSIAYVILGGTAAIGLMRWLWWRLNAIGDLSGIITAWVMAILILFAHVFDAPARVILHLDAETKFSSDPNLLGARMLLVIISVITVLVIVSLLTKKVDEKHLQQFVAQAKPPKIFWNKVVRQVDCEKYDCEKIGRTLISWAIAVVCIFSFIFGVGKLLLGSPKIGLINLVVFVVTLYITVRRINKDYSLSDGKEPEFDNTKQQVTTAVEN